MPVPTPPAPSRRPRFLALSGTPGTGKTRSARAMPARVRSVELGELALSHQCGRRSRYGVTVDLERLGRWIARQPPPERTTVIVGHLAHFLPIPEVIVLRCHPLELLRRLERARRGTPRTRRANAESEALDGIRIECLRLHRRVHEIDTTDRTPRSVGLEIARLAARPIRPRFGAVDWLSDPRVTDFLLRDPS